MNRKFQILLIDDNPIDVLVLKKTFFNLNADCSFTEFDDAEKAFSYLKVIKEENEDALPDIIISDLILPRMSGNELLAALKEDDIFKSIPFVMFTNSSSEMDVKKAYSHNVNSYIVKPVQFESFAKAVADLGMYWMFHNQPPAV